MKYMVESSNINSVEYNDVSKSLLLEFKSGAFYEYDDVDSKTVEDMVSAESVGRFFNKNVKGVFNYRKVENLQTRDSCKINFKSDS